MTTYTHTQIGYVMLVVALAVLVLFSWVYAVAAHEPVGVDSGTNLLVTSVMGLILCILFSFATLRVAIDEHFVRVKFGYGLFAKKFALDQIASVQAVKNPWYVGWGIRLWLWPKMWIFNVSGFDAVELVLKNGKIYRIGTDVPKALESAIQQAIHA